MAGLNAPYTSIKRVLKEMIVCCKHSYKRTTVQRDLITLAVKKIHMFSDKYERSYDYRKQKKIEMKDEKHYTWKGERKSLFK